VKQYINKESTLVVNYHIREASRLFFRFEIDLNRMRLNEKYIVNKNLSYWLLL
jgi:hypothetical protein